VWPLTPSGAPLPQGCLNFIVLALVSFLREGQWTTRQIVITVLVLVSRFELGAFLFYRVLKRGKDGWCLKAFGGLSGVTARGRGPVM
jgi:hypothetical protein